MTRTVTLTLPDTLYEPIQRAADATKQPVETMLLNVLQTTLPSLEGLPDDLQHELTLLEDMNNDALWQIMLESVPAGIQVEIETLLTQKQTNELNETQQQRLSVLQKSADLVMLRKARAAVLLRFRGRRLPTQVELHQMSIAA